MGVEVVDYRPKIGYGGRDEGIIDLCLSEGDIAALGKSEVCGEIRVAEDLEAEGNEDDDTAMS